MAKKTAQHTPRTSHDSLHGIVVRSTGNVYTVQTDCGRTIDCKVKGSFRLKGIRSTNPVAVGDGVTITDTGEALEYITAIDDRRNYIVRRASNLSKQSHILAANVDALLLLVTPSLPETSTTFIDRVLASAEAYAVPALLVFNKADLYTDEDHEWVEAMRLTYEHIGYDCYTISCHTGEGIEALMEQLTGKHTLLAGHSGVGKSTFLNRLVPGARARTNTISEVHGTGQHTTTFSERFALPEGGSLIDVPGVKGFGSVDMEREEMAHYFREIFAISAECRFSNCTHIHEPGCAVLQALDEYRLSPTRYRSYRSMMEDEEDNKYREGH